jgi:hypothetical protein
LISLLRNKILSLAAEAQAALSSAYQNTSNDVAAAGLFIDILHRCGDNVPVSFSPSLMYAAAAAAAARACLLVLTTLS